MLNKSTLSNDTVLSLCEMMIWLSATYGPPTKQAVPKILNPASPCHERHWGEDDPRTVFAWAQAEVSYLSQLCDMTDWSVQVAPDGNRAKLQSIGPNPLADEVQASSLTSLISKTWSENKYPGYFVDSFGRPTFFYDPRRCLEPGYFAKTILPQFALLKIYAKPPPAEFVEESMEQLVQMTACHMGVGFNLLALAQSGRSQNWTPMAMLNPPQMDKDELPYLYGTLISLAAHRLTREQIIATYGKLMTQRTRKLLDAAYAQVELQAEVLKLLKILSKPIRSECPEYSHHRPAQVSNGPV